VLYGSLSRLRRRDLVLGLLGRPPTRGIALLMRVADRNILRQEGNLVARRWLARPGSTIKPFSLLALLEAGKLNANDAYMCPRQLTIAGRDFACVHPDVPLAMNAARAIAYSCNCAVAHFARRFAPDELAAALVRSGFLSARRNLSGDGCQLQALGEDGMQVTPLELLSAYRRLALRAGEAKLAPILEGLEGAVDFGSAQGAQVKDRHVAGKTGSAFPWAWFAGFAPGPKPEVAVVALVEGRSGSGDAAPIAGVILRKYFER
jgi:cell division protein FtsI/penicillin-binding protein 2